MRLPGLFLTAALMIQASLLAEIENVTISWRNQNCTETCHDLLEKQFLRMPGALDARVDGKAGTATMRWRPRIKFRYTDVNIAVRSVGVPLMDIRLRIRGTISQTGRKFTLSSLGDETVFNLLSPLTVQPNRMATPQNVDSYELSPDMQKKLVDSELGFYVVTVSGVLLMPERSPPYYLVVENIEGGPPPAPPPLKKESIRPASRMPEKGSLNNTQYQFINPQTH